MIAARTAPMLSTLAGLALLSTASLAQDIAASDALGGGSSGALGVPRLALHGSPVLGEPFGLRMDGGAPASAAFLAISGAQVVLPLPFYGSATAHPAWPPVASALLPTDAGGSTPLFLEQVALDASLGGVQVFAQGVVVDAGAQGGLAFTGALSIEIGVAAGPAFPGSWLLGPALAFSEQGFTWTALVDLDADGRDDLMGYTASIDWTTSVHLGHPDGGFPTEAPSSWTPLTNPVVVDLDGDGILDALGNRYFGFPGISSLAFLRGQGDGTFSHDASYDVDAGFRVVGGGDVDGDGLSDAVVWRSGPELWSLSDFASGSSGFPVASPTSLVISTWCAPALVDVNDDGNLDVVGCGASGALAVQLADGSGGFAAASTVGTAVNSPSMLVADVNGDGRDDVTILSRGVHTQAQSFIVEGSAGAATLVPRPIASFPEVSVHPYGAWFDVDRDGNLDLAFADVDRIHIAFGDGNGGLSASVPLLDIDSARELHFGDVDGDGATDLVLSGAGGVGVFAVQVIGPGDVRIETSDVAVAGGDFTAVAAADLDRDGVMDVVASRESGGITVAHGNGDGTFVVAQALASGIGTRDVQLADVDGDDLLDAVAVEYSTGALSVFRGTAAGVFEPATTQLVGSGAGSLTLVDVDQDGLLDAMIAYETVARLGVLLGAPGGGFGGPTFITLPAPAGVVRHADMDGDGLDDVVAVNRGSLVLHQLPGGGLGAPQSLNGESFDGPQGTFLLPGSHGFLADVDGDGDVDVVLGGSSSTGYTDHLVVNRNPLIGSGSYDYLGLRYSKGLSGVTHMDADGDGVREIVATHVQGAGWQVAIDAAGEIVLEDTFHSRLARPVAADVDGNWIDDLIGFSELGVEVLLNGLVD